MKSPRSTALADGQVHLPRLADVVAERIRDLILRGELTDGERLPPLDSLLEEFGVSGPSMREALRILEAEGLIVVQRGSIGGAVIHRPTPKTAAYTLALVLRSQGTQKGDVAEALSLLAALCAMLCARRPDRKSTVVRELRKANTRARRLIDADDLAFNDAMMEFHAILLQQCPNDTMKLLSGALGSLWKSDARAWAKSASEHGHYPTAEARVAEIVEHEQITELISAGEDLEAWSAMMEHLDETEIYTVVDATLLVNPQEVRLR